MPPLTPRSRRDEFADGASLWPEDLDRREFVKLMAASVALAGLAGCERPAKALVPYVVQPPGIVPGRAVFYATALPLEGYGRGLLVETHEGRPTKIEGNPAHPESLGATDAVTQASILGLYDPDRSQGPQEHGVPSSWAAFEGAWFERREAILAERGSGFAILTEPSTSPTLLGEIHRLLDRHPLARWYQHTPLPRYDLDGAQGDCDFGKPDVILAIESDFLGRHPAALRHTRAFAARRRITDGIARPNRLYVIEAGWSLAGGMADHRLAASPASLRRVLDAVAAALGSGEIPSGLDPAEQHFAAAVAADLRLNAPRILCIAGAEQPDDVRRWARALNQRLGAGTVETYSAPVRSDADSRCAGDLASLAGAIAAKEVRTLAILGSNPAYTGFADLAFAEELSSVEFSVHLGSHADETAACCRWHLPESHCLEAWSDVRGYDGTAAIQQPMIEPLHATRSAAELVRLLADGTATDDYSLVRGTWQARNGGGGFEERWSRWLNQGLVDGERSPAPVAPGIAAANFPRLAGQPAGESLTLLLRPDPFVSDGRWANNGWLQELPRPFTSLVWDNALLVAPEFAAARGLENGNRVTLELGGKRLLAPVWTVPGMAPECGVLHLGWGRSRAGGVGTGRGVNAYGLRTAAGAWQISGVGCSRAPGAGQLVSTQHHFTMEGRNLARTVAFAELKSAAREPEHDGSLYGPWPRVGHAWGMSIDLSTCIGCAACVAACQAENNSPVVGKEQVSRGREMHWIRVDTYFVGEGAALKALSQPVPCMQCENAPCELVCPVGATVHSSEGLNEMVYNRCVGTRYCSNNCPYKVRRFNFFDFRAPAGSPLHLQDNPNVTVRARGVMEKCTYCVQRIDAARIEAEKDNRPLRDGEIRTACQQACPAEAIVFGDLMDPQSAVSRRKREILDYALLAELNTRPRTTYLPRLLNENRG